MSKKYRYEQKKVEVTIADGGTLASNTIKLPFGTCVGMSVAKIDNANHGDFVNLSVKDGGGAVVEASDISFFEKTSGGRWIDSLRPMSFECNRNVEVELSTATALSGGNFKAQVLFVILQEQA